MPTTVARWHCRGHSSRSHLLDQYGCSKPKRRLNRTRADFDGKNRQVIIPEGATHTPKQIHLDKENGKLYWCDREGMRVMRSNLDGSKMETLVETGRGDIDRRDQTRRCYLVVATGVQPNYFGHDEFARHASTLNTITDAELIRTKLLTAYEMAEMTDDADEQARQMTFVLVGAGPTRVELVASIAQLGTVTLRSNFQSAMVLWAAGVSASPIVKMVGVGTDRVGRACIGPFMNVPDQQGIFVVGDASSATQNVRPVPGVAQAAMRQGRYVGRLIAREKGKSQTRPFSLLRQGQHSGGRQEFRHPGVGTTANERIACLVGMGLHPHHCASSRVESHARSKAMTVELFLRTTQLAPHVRRTA